MHENIVDLVSVSCGVNAVTSFADVPHLSQMCPVLAGAQ